MSNNPQFFDEIAPYTRFEGGHKVKITPFISGYWYALIEPPESILFNRNEQYEAVKILHATAESFTPPSRTLNKGEISGFGGVKKYIILNQTISSTFSINFLEFSGMPVRKILSKWTNMNNANYGFNVTDIYKGRAFILLCKPTWSNVASEAYYQGVDIPFSINDIEEMFYFEGIFPESSGTGELQSDISTNDKLVLPITFSFDSYCFGLKHEDIVYDCIEQFTTYIGSYRQDMYDPFD